MNEAARNLRGDAPSLFDAKAGRSARWRNAGVNLGAILEPSDHDPRETAELPENLRLAPPALRPVRHDVVPVLPPGDGLRLMPLAAFHWGGRERGIGALPQPRLRGDHVLLHLHDGLLQIDFPRLQSRHMGETLAFLPSGTAFSMRPDAQLSGQALLIPPRLTAGLQMPLPQEFRSGTPLAADGPMLGPALRALAEGTPKDQAARIAMLCQIELISVALSRLTFHRPGQADALGSRTHSRPLTERFLSLASQNLASGRTMSELAAALGCSLAVLDQACRQTRGRSALELTYELRMERAVSALRTTRVPIPQIAQDLGYSSVGHFMRAFANATGRTPEAFRAAADRGAPKS